VKSSSCILVNSDKLTDNAQCRRVSYCSSYSVINTMMPFAMAPLSLCHRLACGCIAQSVCEAKRRVYQSRAFVCKQMHVLSKAKRNTTSKSPLAWRTHDVLRVRTDERSYSHNSGSSLLFRRVLMSYYMVKQTIYSVISEYNVDEYD